MSRETRPQLKCARLGKRYDLKELCSKTSLTTSVTIAYQTAVKLRLKDISTLNFSPPSFNPGPFNPRLYNHEVFNPDFSTMTF